LEKKEIDKFPNLNIFKNFIRNRKSVFGIHNFDKLAWELDSLLNLDVDNY